MNLHLRISPAQASAAPIGLFSLLRHLNLSGIAAAAPLKSHVVCVLRGVYPPGSGSFAEESYVAACQKTKGMQSSWELLVFRMDHS